MDSDLVVLLSLLLSAQAQDPARLALLIGNQGYATKVGALRNPHNDITLIDASLKKLPMASLTRNRCR